MTADDTPAAPVTTRGRARNTSLWVGSGLTT